MHAYVDLFLGYINKTIHNNVSALPHLEDPMEWVETKTVLKDMAATHCLQKVNGKFMLRKFSAYLFSSLFS